MYTLEGVSRAANFIIAYEVSRCRPPEIVAERANILEYSGRTVSYHSMYISALPKCLF